MRKISVRSKGYDYGAERPFTDYLIVNSYIDERNNPYKASAAAAQLFMTNFRELGTWPLAITAYNHGRGGMQRAIHETGSEQLGTIIRQYKSNSFGFASKNFYSEFLAAVNTYDLLKRQGKIAKTTNIAQAERLILTRSMALKDLIKNTKISPREITQLNPCLNANHVSAQSPMILPKNYQIRLPISAAKLLRRQMIAQTAPTPSEKFFRGDKI